MKIAVCIKQVPASDSKIIVRDGNIDTGSITYVVNPYDEFAVEEALRIKERQGAGEVVVISLGTDKAVEALRTCLALGADRAVHIRDDAQRDSYSTAVILAAAIKKEQPDFLLFGRQAIDDDTCAVGIQVAELLGMPHAAGVNKLDIADGKAIANRQIEGGSEVVELTLPALITCQKELNVPRYASLPGIMKAKSKPLSTETVQSLNIDNPANLTTVVKFTPPPQRLSGKIITSPPEEAVKELAKLLREEAKVL